MFRSREEMLRGQYFAVRALSWEAEPYVFYEKNEAAVKYVKFIGYRSEPYRPNGMMGDPDT